MSFIFANLVWCIVGCGEGAPDGQSLHILSCDTETGIARIEQTVFDVQGTTYFQLNRENSELYTMVQSGKKSAIEKFAIKDYRLGARKHLADLPCEAPCHIALAPDEKEVAFAAYTSATIGTVTRGWWRTTVKSAVLPNEGMGPRDDRQQKAYAHCAFYTPDEQTIGFIDLGCDKIYFYSRGSDGFRPRPEMTIHTDPGDGPRHAIFSRDGKFLFVVNELSSTVASYRFDGRNFSRISKCAMTPPQTNPRTTKAAAIKLTADEKLLMASNRGLDSIAFFDVRDDGSLAFRNRAPLKGSFPRDFELMPGEKFMVVGHKMSDEIQIYAFNREECTLESVGNPIACWRPLCFKFLK